MNKKDAMKWVEALRSGKYKQGSKLLHNTGDNTYCCLGVLNKIMPEKYTTYNSFKTCLKPNGHFKSCLGRIPSLEHSLAFLNDGTFYPNYIKLNFDEIADIIQIFYKEL